MGTISKEIAADVIAGKYEDDHPVKIVKYANKWGGESYGLVCAHEHPDRYSASEFIIEPTIYWEHPTNG